MVRACEFCIKGQIARAVFAAVKGNDGIGPATRNIFVDRLPNTRFELGQVARQIDDDVALLPVHGVELDAKPRPGVIGLGATVSSHASHISTKSLSQKNAQRSTLNLRGAIDWLASLRR